MLVSSFPATSIASFNSKEPIMSWTGKPLLPPLGHTTSINMTLITRCPSIRRHQTPVRGVIIDAAQIAVGFSRFSRGFTFRTEAQIEEWLTNTKEWLARAEDYAVAGFWPMNDKACHHYGGCVFRKVCSKSPEVRHKFLETDFVKKQWNPLEPR